MARYTSAADVQSQLGRALTAEQIAYLEASIIPAAEEWVDVTGGRSYGVASVVGEQLVFAGTPYTWLTTVPVTAISELRGYLWGQSAADMAVIAPTGYSLMDARTGYLYMPSHAQYARLEIDYTTDATIPARIKLATSIVCGVYMRTVLHPQTEWLTDYASGQDVRLKFKELKIPETVYDMISGATGSYVIA
jgi:hypothetical protein